MEAPMVIAWIAWMGKPWGKREENVRCTVIRPKLEWLRIDFCDDKLIFCDDELIFKTWNIVESNREENQFVRSYFGTVKRPSGDNIAFIYPDYETALIGKFRDQL